jgi:hypothetical protein
VALNTAQGGAMGTEIFVGENRSILTDKNTYSPKNKRGKLGKLIVSGVGTAWTIDIYDDPTTTNNVVYSWVTADGKVNLDLEIPLANGLTIVSGGTTAGQACIVWS